MKRRMTQVWRPAIALIATVTLLVGVYSFAPTRALAREFLSIFRAENLAVVEIDADTEQINAAMEQVGTLLEGIEPSETIDGSAQVVETVEEASQLAGFEVRMPSQLLGNPLLSIEVKGPDTATFKVSREILGQFLALAGMDPARLPDGFEQGMANIEMPGTVMMEGNNWTLVQALSPVITYPSDIDPQVLGEAGFRLLGMSEKDARRISREIDWTTTLIMPMPRDLSELREVEVAGETAILVSTTRKTDQATDKSLMWEKDGVLNMLSFPGSTERLLKIAESLY